MYSGAHILYMTYMATPAKSASHVRVHVRIRTCYIACETWLEKCHLLLANGALFKTGSLLIYTSPAQMHLRLLLSS